MAVGNKGTTPLQTVDAVQRYNGKSRLTLSCGHVIQVSHQRLQVGDRFQCRSTECRDPARQAALDAMNLASIIAGKLEMRQRADNPDVARHLTPAPELQAMATELQAVLATLAAAERAEREGA